MPRVVSCLPDRSTDAAETERGHRQVRRSPTLVIACLFGLVFGATAVLLLGRAALAAPQLTWSPDALAQTIETGKNTTFSVAFTLSENVGSLDVDVVVVPELQDYVSVAPNTSHKFRLI